MMIEWMIPKEFVVILEPKLTTADGAVQFAGDFVVKTFDFVAAAVDIVQL